MTMQKIERLLEDQPVPPPPEGLVDQIKAEIPDNIEIHPGLFETDRVVPWHRRNHVRLAVAAIFVVALTAAVSWRLRQQPPVQPQLADSQTVVPDASTDQDGSPTSDVVPQGQPQHEGRDQREGVSTADVVREPSENSRAVADSENEVPAGPNSEMYKEIPAADPDAGESYPDAEQMAKYSTFSDQVLPSLGVSVEADGEVTDEMIEQAMENSFEGDVSVTGSLIPRADLTALSPVVVTEEPSTGEVRRDGAKPGPVEDRRTASNEVSGSPSSEVTDQMIEQAMERSFEGEVTVTGGRPPSNRPSSNWRSKWSSKGDDSATASRSKMNTPIPSTGGTDEPNGQPYGDVLFREYGVNPFIDTEDDRFSTFGLEVDTGSYNVIRRYLMDGNLPPREAVRLEEIINAFDYRDEPPEEGDFALSAEGAPSPFADGSRYKIVRLGVTGRTVADADRPPAILTFVVDTSGSMNHEKRLDLVKKALHELLANLRKDDRVALVTYGSRGRVLLEPSIDHEQIRRAIDRLSASGSTNAEEGLVLAYLLADRFSEGDYINRVILCSDGVANVGRTGPESILERIKSWADNGIELTTVGFGMGNYNDVLMEQLADAGDGRYAYVDTLDEANRLFGEQLTGTLFTIGSEAKAQVEFNPEVVSRYRLIGYENRDIVDESFRDPTIDAGEIGAGHTATAVYEIKLRKKGERGPNRDLATLRVRYRPSGSKIPVELEKRIELRDLENGWRHASPSLRLATLVAEYGELLKRSYWARTGDMREVLYRARELAPAFKDDERFADWIVLVEKAAELLSEAGDKEVGITD